MERIKYIDLTKGLLICGVVWGHLEYNSRTIFGYGLYDGGDYYSGIFVPAWMYHTFGMCCFFVISGMFDKSNTLKSIYRCFRTLVVPSFCITIPFISLQNIIVNHDVNIVELFTNWSAPWFISALFWMKCISFVFNRLKINNKYKILATLLLHLIGLYLLKRNMYCFGIGMSLVFYQFYFIGRFVDKLQNTNGFVWLSLFLCSIIINNVLFGSLPNLEGGFDEEYLQIPFSILIGLCGSMSFLKLTKKLHSNKIIEYIGERSLMIYLVHGFIQVINIVLLYKHIFKPLFEINRGLAGLIWIVVLFIIPIIVSIVIHNIINRTKLKVIVGK